MTNRRGFTLAELLIAIGIFTFGALIILGLFNAAMVAHRAAVDRTTAAMAAQNLVARHRYAFSGSERPESWPNQMLAQDLPDFPGYRYRVQFEKIEDSRNPSTDLYDAYVMLVEISWGPKNSPRFERLRTVILRRTRLDE